MPRRNQQHLNAFDAIGRLLQRERPNIAKAYASATNKGQPRHDEVIETDDGYTLLIEVFPDLRLLYVQVIHDDFARLVVRWDFSRGDSIDPNKGMTILADNWPDDLPLPE